MVQALRTCISICLGLSLSESKILTHVFKTQLTLAILQNNNHNNYDDDNDIEYMLYTVCFVSIVSNYYGDRPTCLRDKAHFSFRTHPHLSHGA